MDVKGVKYNAMSNNIVEDESPLDVIFPNKFRRLFGAKKKADRAEEEAPLNATAANLEEVRLAATTGMTDEEQGEFVEGGLRREPIPEDADVFEKDPEKKKGRKSVEGQGESKGDHSDEKPAEARASTRAEKSQGTEGAEEEEEEEEDKPKERDVTSKFELAEKNDYTVIQVRGQGYSVMDGKKKLNKEPLPKKKDAEKFIDDLVGTE